MMDQDSEHTLNWPNAPDNGTQEPNSCSGKTQASRDECTKRVQYFELKPCLKQAAQSAMGTRRLVLKSCIKPFPSSSSSPSGAGGTEFDSNQKPGTNISSTSGDVRFPEGGDSSWTDSGYVSSPLLDVKSESISEQFRSETSSSSSLSSATLATLTTTKKKKQKRVRVRRHDSIILPTDLSVAVDRSGPADQNISDDQIIPVDHSSAADHRFSSAQNISGNPRRPNLSTYQIPRQTRLANQPASLEDHHEENGSRTVESSRVDVARVANLRQVAQHSEQLPDVTEHCTDYQIVAPNTAASNEVVPSTMTRMTAATDRSQEVMVVMRARISVQPRRTRRGDVRDSNQNQVCRVTKARDSPELQKEYCYLKNFNPDFQRPDCYDKNRLDNLFVNKIGPNQAETGSSCGSSEGWGYQTDDLAAQGHHPQPSHAHRPRRRLDPQVYECYIAGVLQSTTRSAKFLSLQRLYASLERGDVICRGQGRRNSFGVTSGNYARDGFELRRSRSLDCGLSFGWGKRCRDVSTICEDKEDGSNNNCFGYRDICRANLNDNTRSNDWRFISDNSGCSCEDSNNNITNNDGNNNTSHKDNNNKNNDNDNNISNDNNNNNDITNDNMDSNVQSKHNQTYRGFINVVEGSCKTELSPGLRRQNQFKCDEYPNSVATDKSTITITKEPDCNYCDRGLVENPDKNKNIGVHCIQSSNTVNCGYFDPIGKEDDFKNKCKIIEPGMWSDTCERTKNIAKIEQIPLFKAGMPVFTERKCSPLCDRDQLKADHGSYGKWRRGRTTSVIQEVQFDHLLKKYHRLEGVAAPASGYKNESLSYASEEHNMHCARCNMRQHPAPCTNTTATTPRALCNVCTEQHMLGRTAFPSLHGRTVFTHQTPGCLKPRESSVTVHETSREKSHTKKRHQIALYGYFIDNNVNQYERYVRAKSRASKTSELTSDDAESADVAADVKLLDARHEMNIGDSRGVLAKERQRRRESSQRSHNNSQSVRRQRHNTHDTSLDENNSHVIGSDKKDSEFFASGECPVAAVLLETEKEFKRGVNESREIGWRKESRNECLRQGNSSKRTENRWRKNSKPLPGTVRKALSIFNASHGHSVVPYPDVITMSEDHSNKGMRIISSLNAEELKLSEVLNDKAELNLDVFDDKTRHIDITAQRNVDKCLSLSTTVSPINNASQVMTNSSVMREIGSYGSEIITDDQKYLRWTTDETLASPYVTSRHQTNVYRNQSFDDNCNIRIPVQSATRLDETGPRGQFESIALIGCEWELDKRRVRSAKCGTVERINTVEYFPSTFENNSKQRSGFNTILSRNAVEKPTAAVSRTAAEQAAADRPPEHKRAEEHGQQFGSKFMENTDAKNLRAATIAATIDGISAKAEAPSLAAAVDSTLQKGTTSAPADTAKWNVTATVERPAAATLTITTCQLVIVGNTSWPAALAKPFKCYDCIHTTRDEFVASGNNPKLAMTWDGFVAPGNSSELVQERVTSSDTTLYREQQMKRIKSSQADISRINETETRTHGHRKVSEDVVMVDGIQKADALYPVKTHSAKFVDRECSCGDVINIYQAVDGQWVERECRGQTGRFPSGYLKMIPSCDEKRHDNQQFGASEGQVHLQGHGQGEGVARVRYNYVPRTNQELPLKQGDNVTITRQLNEHWFEGRIGRNFGLILATYIDVIAAPTAAVVAAASAAAVDALVTSNAGSTAARCMMIPDNESKVSVKQPYPQSPIRLHHREESNFAKHSDVTDVIVDNDVVENKSRERSIFRTSTISEPLGMHPGNCCVLITDV